MKVYLDKDQLIRRIAEKGNFTLGDTRVFLESFIAVIEDCLWSGIGISVNGLGRLYVQDLPERKSSKLLGEKILPPTKRVIFRLSENLRKIVKE